MQSCLPRLIIGNIFCARDAGCLPDTSMKQAKCLYRRITSQSGMPTVRHALGQMPRRLRLRRKKKLPVRWRTTRSDSMMSGQGRAACLFSNQTYRSAPMLWIQCFHEVALLFAFYFAAVGRAIFTLEGIYISQQCMRLDYIFHGGRRGTSLLGSW